MNRTSHPQPFEEPVRQTILRTVTIALVVGGVIALSSRTWWNWPLWTLLALWPSFGGHGVEVWFLNGLRPRLSPNPGGQAAIRVLIWFAGGCLIALGMLLTASAFVPWRPPHWFSWWLGGAAFVAIELVVHLFMQLRGKPNFYSGAG